MVTNFSNYGYYQELAKTKYQTIYTKDINDDNIDIHFGNIINIMNDGIETEDVQSMIIHVVFPDDEVDLYIVQYMYNLMFWSLITCAGLPITSMNLYFERAINKGSIKRYIDKQFIRKNIGKINILKLNQSIDRSIGKFRDLRNYQMFLANTVDFRDTIDFMKKYPEFNETMHLDISNVPIEDAKEYGMEATNKQIKYILRDDEDHNQKYPFMSGEGTNPKQFKEVNTNIGPKPNGQGGVFQHAIGNSFINGGLQSIEDIIIDSSIGRIAQILTKQNVGQSGAFARRLGLNNQDSLLNPDPEYICDTRNFERVTIKNKDILEIYDMRWYKFNENGPEYYLDAEHDHNLIGQTLYFRSPITCASAARGNGICYRCYGNLAYVNNNINIGQMAADQLSSIYTQTLLSAKHLLESAIIKMSWNKEFYDLFLVDFDQIMLKDDYDYKKYKLVIDGNDIVENDFDDSSDDDQDQMEEANYIFSFTVVYPDGHSVTVKTSDSDPIYITEDFAQLMESEGSNDNDLYEFNMEKLKALSSLFTIDVQNNELSKVMKQVKNLIDNKQSIKSLDRNTILESFIDANLKGRIKINAVHFEVLLMNQTRDGNDMLMLPDWTLRNAPYQVITLEDALSNNLSINIRLQSPKLKRTIIHPSNRRIHKPSNMDLFTMENPQEFMDESLYDKTENKKRKIVKPLYFVKGPDTGIKK